MNKQRLALAVASGLGAIATFLPWVTVPFMGSVNGTAGTDGWINLALFAVPLVLSLLNDRSTPLTGGKLYGAIVPGILAGVIGIWKIIDCSGEMVSIGVGLYIIALAGIAIPIAGFVVKDKTAASA